MSQATQGVNNNFELDLCQRTALLPDIIITICDKTFKFKLMIIILKIININRFGGSTVPYLD